MEMLWSGDHTLSGKDFRTAKQTLEAGRMWGVGQEGFHGRWGFLGAKAGHIWQILLLGAIGYLTLHFWHPALQELYASEGRVCWFVYSW